MVVFLVCWVVYNVNGIPISSSDNKASLLLPHALLTRGSLDLAPYFSAVPASEAVPYYYRRYGPVVTSDKLVFYAVVATPFYAAGWGMVRLVHGPLPELRFAHYADDPPLAWFAVEKATASLMAATTSAVIFLAGWVYWRRRGVALGAAGLFALLSSHWATSSQGMWNHGGLALLAATVVLAWALLERAAADGLGARATGAILLIGSVAAAWAMPVRTPGAGYAWLWLGYVGWRWRRRWWLAAVAIAAMAVIFFAFNLAMTGSLAGYYGMGQAPFWVYGWAENFKAWAGLLVSPGAGLFFFSPWAVFAVVGAVVAWRRRQAGDAAMLIWGVPVVVCWAAAATNTDSIPQLRWHAAASYGPRYFVDALPALTLLAVHGVLGAWAAAGQSRVRRVSLAVAAGAMMLWSAGTQVVGVFFFKFNHALRPVPIHLSTERMWAWRDNPLSRELRTGLNYDVCLVWATLLGYARAPVEVTDARAEVAVSPAGWPAGWTAGERCMVEVAVRNTGTTAWPMTVLYGAEPPRLEGVWCGPRGERIPAVPERTLVPLDWPLATGGERRFPVLVAAPPAPGDYTLEWSVRQGARDWLTQVRSGYDVGAVRISAAPDTR